VEDAAERLAQVEDRLALLDRVKRRHGPSLDAVLAWWEGARVELENLQHQRDPHALEAAVAGAEEAFLAVARGAVAGAPRRRPRGSRGNSRTGWRRWRWSTRGSRCGSAPNWSPDRWSTRGVDDAEFFVSANLGEDTRPLARVASGGELSRVMLALHLVTLGRRRESGRTLIFDEVDAGIGGRVADAVGECLQMLGRQFQVLCITHLPAIAARATTQFVVEKETRGGRTRTLVTRLDDAGPRRRSGADAGGRAADRSRAAGRPRSADGLPDRTGGERRESAKGESESPSACYGAAGVGR
jgi:DNA repair protein RecN (Recombination protein N)